MTLLWSSAHALPTPLMCLQGEPKNNDFAKALFEAAPDRNSLIGGYKAEGVGQARQGWMRLGSNALTFLTHTHASHRNCALKHDNLADYDQLLHAIHIPQIKRQCIEAAVQRSVPGGNNYCASDSGAPRTYSSNSTGQCITEEVASYYQWAIRQAYACISYVSNGPLDMKLLFRIYNNESGFSVFQKASAGMGIGQLTTSAVKDMAEENKPGVFDRVLASNRPECRPFQTALREHKPASPNEICRFQNPNNGIARQLIYTMGYLVRVRDGLLNMPARLNKVGIEDIRYANMILAIRYSAEAGKAPGLLAHLERNPTMSYEQFVKYVEANTNYASNMKSTFEHLKAVDPTITSAEDCIEY